VMLGFRLEATQKSGELLHLVVHVVPFPCLKQEVRHQFLGTWLLAAHEERHCVRDCEGSTFDHALVGVGAELEHVSSVHTMEHVLALDFERVDAMRFFSCVVLVSNKVENVLFINDHQPESDLAPLHNPSLNLLLVQLSLLSNEFPLL